MDQITALSKAITAVVTYFVMAWLKTKLYIEDLDISTQLQTVVSVAADAVTGMVIGFFTWLIPLGKSYIESHILGKHVLITTATGQVTTGEVTSVIPEVKT